MNHSPREAKLVLVLVTLAASLVAPGFPRAHGAEAGGKPAVDLPVTITTGTSGHVHPSLVRTRKGTLVVVYKLRNGLMCARSTDNGATWNKPFLIATSVKRPAAIRETRTFEVYPGTADLLPDGRILVTWNFIADDGGKPRYYERALLYTLSDDDGQTWSEQQLIGPIDGKHLGAVRHQVLTWKDGRWLLPLRAGTPRLYDPKTGKFENFAVVGPDGKQHFFTQILRTTKGSLLAMGPVLLHSNDDGKSWSQIENFPAVPSSNDNIEGRYLTPLPNGDLLVTWGVNRDNKGLWYSLSKDDGKSWTKTVKLLPERRITAHWYSPRTVSLDSEHVGTVFIDSKGVHFLKVQLARLAPGKEQKPEKRQQAATE